jgi:hypothetical protein
MPLSFIGRSRPPHRKEREGEVTVIREAPRSRSRVEWFCGSLDVSITALKDLHIGWVQSRLGVKEGEATAMLERIGDWTRTVEELAKGLKLDYQPFCECGGMPTIPGATVKGNVRSRIELGFRENMGRVRSCFVEAGREGSWRHRAIWADVIREQRPNQCKFNPREGMDKVCLVCDLFGTTSLAGLVKFSDFMGRDTVIQDRDFEFNMKLRVAPKGSVFRGRIDFFNLRPEELGLLLLGMGMQNGAEGKPVLMGRLKYRYHDRIGQVKYRLETIRLSELSKDALLGVVRAGEEVEGAKVAGELIRCARNAYEDFQPIDEVERLTEAKR